MTPEQITGLRNYARQQEGIRHVSMSAETVIELCDEAEAAERMRRAMRECDGITSRNGDFNALVVSFRTREAADLFLQVIDPPTIAPPAAEKGERE